MNYSFNQYPIFAMPIINGQLVSFTTDFSFSENKAEVTCLLVDKTSVEFIDRITQGDEHELSVKFGESDKTHILFEECRIYISRIESAMDEFTSVELTIETY